MKRNKMLVLLFAIFAFGWANVGVAQYDDLYYNPDTDGDYYYSSSSNNYQSNTYSSSNSYNSNYDDDGYGYYDYDDYNYHYTSRIRRFHRPYYGFNYFDPVYVDMAYYDPFWSPGFNTVLIYDSFWSYRSWNRWNRWNRWNYGFGWNSWNGPNAWVGYGNPWGNPWGNIPGVVASATPMSSTTTTARDGAVVALEAPADSVVADTARSTARPVGVVVSPIIRLPTSTTITTVPGQPAPGLPAAATTATTATVPSVHRPTRTAAVL